MNLLLALLLALTAGRPVRQPAARYKRVTVSSSAADLSLLRKVNPPFARVRQRSADRWQGAQTRQLTELLEEGQRKAEGGGKPAIAIDIHDTLEAVKVAGLEKRDPNIRAAPGGPEFVRAALARGIRVVLLSNTKETYREEEYEALRMLGYPVQESQLGRNKAQLGQSFVLMMRPKKLSPEENWKEKASKQLKKKKYEVIAHFDNEQGNLDAIRRFFPESVGFQVVLDPTEESRFPKIRNFTLTPPAPQSARKRGRP